MTEKVHCHCQSPDDCPCPHTRDSVVDLRKRLAEAINLLDGLLELKKGSGNAALKFVEDYRAVVGETS